MHEITWGGKSEKQVLTHGHALCYTHLPAAGFGHQSGVSVINPTAAFIIDKSFVGHLLHCELTESRVMGQQTPFGQIPKNSLLIFVFKIE